MRPVLGAVGRTPRHIVDGLVLSEEVVFTYARRVHRDLSQLAELAEIYDKNGMGITLKCVLLYKKNLLQKYQNARTIFHCYMSLKSLKSFEYLIYTYMDRCKEIVYVHVFMDCHLISYIYTTNKHGTSHASEIVSPTKRQQSY